MKGRTRGARSDGHDEADAGAAPVSKKAKLLHQHQNSAASENTCPDEVAAVEKDSDPMPSSSSVPAAVGDAYAAAVTAAAAATAIIASDGLDDTEPLEEDLPDDHRFMAQFAAKAIENFRMPTSLADFEPDPVPQWSKHRSVIYDFGLKATNNNDNRTIWFCLCNEQCQAKSLQGSFIAIKGSAANCTVHLREKHGILGLRSRKFISKHSSAPGSGKHSDSLFDGLDSMKGGLLRSMAARTAAVSNNRPYHHHIRGHTESSSNSTADDTSQGLQRLNRQRSNSLTISHMPSHLPVPLAEYWADYFARHKERMYQVLAGPRMEKLATEIARQKPDRFLYHETKWQKFPDGTDRITIGGFQPVNMISGQHVLLLCSFHNNDVTLSQFSVMVTLLQSFVESLTVVLPFYPVGTMERVSQEGQVATANTYAQMFSNLPTCGKPTRLIVYDLHTLQNRFYLHGNAIASLQTAIPLLIERIKNKYPHIDCIAFPDDGAAKRFGAMFDGLAFGIVTCGKTRDGDKRVVVIQDGSPKDKNVVIVDDLVQTGGTLYECGLALKSAGAKEVNAFVAHGVFPNNAWREFVRGGGFCDVFHKFFVTNSIPTITAALPKNDVFETIDLSTKIVQDLDKYSS